MAENGARCVVIVECERDMGSDEPRWILAYEQAGAYEAVRRPPNARREAPSRCRVISVSCYTRYDIQAVSHCTQDARRATYAVSVNNAVRCFARGVVQ